MTKNKEKSVGKVNVVSLAAKRKEASRKPAPSKGRKSSAAGPISKEVYVLWNLAQNIDELLETCVIKDKVATEEVAAILAHRLGTLVSVSPDPKKLRDFCLKVIRKQADESHDEAS